MFNISVKKNFQNRWSVSQTVGFSSFHYRIQFNFPRNPFPVGNKFYALLIILLEASDGQDLFEVLTEIENAKSKNLRFGFL